MKAFANAVVTLYVILSATPLLVVGFLLMLSPFIAAHYRALQISDVNNYFTGVPLFFLGVLFLYGIYPDQDFDEEINDYREEDMLALPATITA